MRALIVDSALKGLGGHNFSYTKAVETQLARRGCVVEVLANQGLPADLARANGFIPTFSMGAYDFPCALGTLPDLMYLYAQSVIFEAQLEAAYRARPATYDLIFSHTMSDFELIAWHRFLKRREWTSRLIFLMRTTPRYVSMPSWKRRLHPYFRIRPVYLNAISKRMRGKFTLVTDSEALSADYAAIYHGRIVTLPIPVPTAVYEAHDGVAPSVLDQYSWPQGRRPLLGFLGDRRRQKGFYLLPSLIDDLLQAHPEVGVVVQCPTNSYEQPPAESADMKALDELASRWPQHLTLIPEALDDATYVRLFNRLDVVLVPYQRQGYVEPTSGIFAEALAAGKPVVVPSGTWMAGELARAGAGVVFEPGNARDLAVKTGTLVDRYEEFARRAMADSQRWRAFHNAGTLADMLLAEAAR